MYITLYGYKAITILSTCTFTSILYKYIQFTVGTSLIHSIEEEEAITTDRLHEPILVTSTPAKNPSNPIYTLSLANFTSTISLLSRANCTSVNISLTTYPILCCFPSNVHTKDIALDLLAQVKAQQGHFLLFRFALRKVF